MNDYVKLAEIACQDFADIVTKAEIRPEKLRVHLVDGRGYGKPTTTGRHFDRAKVESLEEFMRLLEQIWPITGIPGSTSFRSVNRSFQSQQNNLLCAREGERPLFVEE